MSGQESLMSGQETPGGFDTRDLRRSMDVYTRDGVYLGTVLAVVPGPALPPEGVAPGARQSSAGDGERLGPAPTAAVGNGGPGRQSAGALYATPSDGAAPAGAGYLVVGKWWGLRGRRRLPLRLVETVALERVVLRLEARDLPRE
jgi:hypothetical protein